MMNYKAIITTGTGDQVLELFQKYAPDFTLTGSDKTTKDRRAIALKEYNPQTHDIQDSTARPDKMVTKDTGEKDRDGNPIEITVPVAVTRISLPLQKKIVNGRTGFMLTEPVEIIAKYNGEGTDAEKRLTKLVGKIQDANKMDYKNKEIARRLMSELEVAEIWYLTPNADPSGPKFTLKVRIISPGKGDKLLPLFDDYDDMVAFARQYKRTEDNGEQVEHLDVYTPEFEYRYIQTQAGLQLDPSEKTNPIPNAIKKIPVIYYTQPESEWADVQDMIDRLETSISNHGDMNDYFGSPILSVAGDILGFAQKGEQGKILAMDKEAKAGYLELTAEPASIKMEQDTLMRLINYISQTADISFEAMKGLGANLTGVALKMMFLDSHMAVARKEEILGIGLQRRLNLIMAAITNVIDTGLAPAGKTTTLKPIIKPFLPVNDTETIDNLSVSKTAGIISRETAVRINPLVEDPDGELARLDQDTIDQMNASQM